MGDITVLTGIALLITGVFVIVKTIAYVLNGDWRDAAGVLVWWVAGVIVACIANSGAVFDGVAVGDAVLGSLDVPDVVLVGLALGSAANAANDARKAVDSSDTSRRPELFKNDG